MAALRSENKAEKPEKPNHEYRIIVSNLRNTVTSGDIEVRKYINIKHIFNNLNK